MFYEGFNEYCLDGCDHPVSLCFGICALFKPVHPSANQLALFQIAKAFVASLYCLIFIIPIFLAQSRQLILQVIGYFILIAYFSYVFFLTGYFAYFGFVPEIYALGMANAADLRNQRGSPASERRDLFLSSAPAKANEKVNFYTGRTVDLIWHKLGPVW